ncbi:MAG: type I-E CRISPR-associated protein Cas6/Cse3/CasE [Akkermansia sp.]
MLHEDEAAHLLPRDAYALHRLVWRFFPGMGKRRFLYRADYAPGGARLCMLSPLPPQCPADLPQDRLCCAAIPPDFCRARDYRFCLRANPTKRSLEPPGRRLPLTGNDELLRWLRRKGEQGGFLPGEDVRAIPEAPLPFCKPGCAPALHHSVQFCGSLSVRDPETFRRAREHGFGSAKSFGFGLMLLTPLSPIA